MYGYLKDDKIILNYYFFRKKILKNRRRKIYCTKSKIYEKMNKPKIHIFVIKHYLFLVFVTSVEVKMNKHLEKKNQLNY